MMKKFLKEVMTLVAGKQAEALVDLLDGKKYVNEFLIAKKMDLTINQTRNILYKISDHGLVSSIRKKDKKKGWYTYFWRIEILKALEFFQKILIKKIDQLKFQIKSREVKDFYICERCNVEFNEETALLYDFTCRECGGVFVLKDNSKLLKELKRRLERLNGELKLVEEEIGSEKSKLEKARLRELNKEKKLLEKKKAAKKAARKKPVKKKVPTKKASEKTTKKKLAKKVKTKKTPVKKTVPKKPVKKKTSAKKKIVKKKVPTKKTTKKKK